MMETTMVTGTEDPGRIFFRKKEKLLVSLSSIYLDLPYIFFSISISFSDAVATVGYGFSGRGIWFFLCSRGLRRQILGSVVVIEMVEVWVRSRLSWFPASLSSPMRGRR